jgi:hypothetical protein
MVSCRGGVLLPVRTGYEQVIANRCNDNFAYDAKGDGKVLSNDGKVLSIEYTDEHGEVITVGVPLGVKHGVTPGSIIPHSIVSDMKPGSKFKAGDVLAWNEGYFQRDYLNKNGASMKGGTLARVVLMEGNDTLEDGSAISPSLSGRLSTPVGKVKTLAVTFDQSVENLVTVGTKVKIDTVLAVLEDGSLAGVAGKDKNLLGLSKLTASTPKAKAEGVISKIEVVYYGDKADMHPTLRNIANADARRRKEILESTNSVGSPTGELTDRAYINGQKITKNMMAISIYIDSDLSCDIGDKVVFDNVLKSIVGRVMEGTNATEDGEPIDAIFGYASVSARIILSPEINGITNTTLLAASKKFADIYFGN